MKQSNEGRMRRFHVVALVVAASSCADLQAAITINFDSQALGPISASAFSALGVTFSNATVDNFLGVEGISSPNAIYSTNGGTIFPEAKAIVATFASPVSMVSVTAVDIGANGATLKAYDSVTGGSVIDFDTQFGQTGGGNTTLSNGQVISEFLTLSVSGTGIRRVEIFQANQSLQEGVAFDNFTFELQSAASVPEPGTFAMFALAGLSLLGTTIRRRRPL